ncbi:dipeptidase [Cellulophaga sp. BC115SP]|uniref:dipeptidase n=1 Tax=Cellulophaga sp. BC115SP TaxID=2683263 RepID=UPI0014131A9E|nr:membrane dipeptidase [Cellulophaga sp. BC115SP]NBB30942.1 peptidase M19 [Cellulophaga sp. BC115SP]
MKEIRNAFTRRHFLTAISGIGGIMLFKPLRSFAIDETDPRIVAIVNKTIAIDTHNHIDVPLKKEELPGPEVALKEEMKKSGLSAICMTFAVDYQKLTYEGEAYERFMNGLDAMDKMLESNQIKRAYNLSDLKKAHKAGTPIVIQSVEGGHFLEGKIERLGIAYQRGLRQLGLLHDNDASVPLGDIYTNPPKFNGLSDFGKEVVKECNRLGILIDLTHCSDAAINDALKLSSKPMVVSHTSLNTQLGQNPSMAKMMMPRLISQEQAKIVANAGGLIGVWRHLTDSPVAYAQNIKAMVDVVGVNHVCLGTDTKLTPAYRSPNANQNRQNNNNNQSKRFGERTNEIWESQHSGYFYTVVEELLKLGLTEPEIIKIGGANFCKVFDEVTKGH